MGSLEATATLSPLYQPEQEQEDNCPNGRSNQAPEEPPRADSQEAKQKAAQQSPDDPDDQVAPKAEPAPLEDLSGEPASGLPNQEKP